MHSEDGHLKEKRILITGADRGIGAAIAVRFAELGAKLFLNLFLRPETSHGLLSQVTREGRPRPLMAQAKTDLVISTPEMYGARAKEMAEQGFTALKIFSLSNITQATSLSGAIC